MLEVLAIILGIVLIIGGGAYTVYRLMMAKVNVVLETIDTGAELATKLEQRLPNKSKDLLKELEETVMLIAQADTGGYLTNHENRRVRYVVEDAKAMTKKYGFFDYWT